MRFDSAPEKTLQAASRGGTAPQADERASIAGDLS